MKKLFLYFLIIVITLVLSVFIGSISADNTSNMSLIDRKIATFDYSKLNREWTDEEIIQLGYMPGELLVMFKKDRVNLKNKNDRKMVRVFFSNKSPYMASVVMRRLARKRGRSLSSEVIPNIVNIEDNFMEVKEDLEFANISVIKLKIDVSVVDVVELLADEADIEAAEPNSVCKFASTSQLFYSDVEYKKNWGLEKIMAKEAWDSMPLSWREGSGSDIIVAVLDTGVAYNHPDLKGDTPEESSMWDGSKGCVDEEGQPIPGGCPNHGWDFNNDDNDPTDDHSHGTHIAGIIAGVANGTGVVGVNPRVKIMAVKIGNAFKIMSEEIKGIKFALNNGAKIINASYNVIREATESEEKLKNIIFNDFKDGLFIAAAGNDRKDIDSLNAKNSYPCALKRDDGSKDNIIGVANSDSGDAISRNSNYGKFSVDVYAPGKDIVSTYFSEETINIKEIMTILPIGSFDQLEENHWVGEEIEDEEGISNYILLTNSLGTAYDKTGEYSIVYNTPISFPEDRVDAIISFKYWYNHKILDCENNLYEYISKDNKKTWNELDDSKTEFIENKNYGNDPGTIRRAEIHLNQELTGDIYLKFTWKVKETGLSYIAMYLDEINIKFILDKGEGEDFKTMSGTSMAAPHVVGVAALVWSVSQYFTSIEVKDIILNTVDPIGDFNPDTGTHPVVSGGRLNAFKAVSKAIDDFFKKGTVIYSSDGIDVWEMLTTDGVVGILGTQKYFDFDTKEREGVVLRGPLLFNDSEWWEIYWGEDKDGNDMIGWSRSPVYTNISYCKKISDIPDQVGEFADKEIEAQYRDAFVKSFIHGYDRISDNDYGMADFKVYKMDNGYDGVWYQTFTALERKTAMILNIEKNKVFRLNHDFWYKYLGELYLGAPLGNEEYEKDANNTIIAIKQEFERGALVYDKNMGEFVVYGPGMIVYSEQGVNVFSEPSPSPSTDVKYDSDSTKNKRGIVLHGPDEYKFYEIYWGKDSNGEEMIGWSSDEGLRTADYAFHVGVFGAYEENAEVYRRAFLKRYFDEYDDSGVNSLDKPVYTVEAGHKYVFKGYNGVWKQYYGESKEEFGVKSSIILNADEGKTFVVKGKILETYVDNEESPISTIKLGAPIGEEGIDGKTITQEFNNGYITYDIEQDSASITFTSAFNDLKNDWAKKYINYVYRNGVVHGYDDGTFGPQNSVSRAELIKMCYRGAYKENVLDDLLDNPDLPDPNFSDVESKDWVYKYLAHAKDEGYIHGKTDGCLDGSCNGDNCFCPNDPVDRYEAAKIIYNIFGAEESDINVPEYDRLAFPDVPTDFWAYKYVNWFANIRVSWDDDNKGVRIASGYKNGKFGKNDSGEAQFITRAEMSKIIANMMNFKGTGPMSLLSSNSGSRKSRSTGNSSSNASTLGFSYEQIYDVSNIGSPESVLYETQTILDNENISYAGDKFDQDGDEMFYFWNTTGGIFTTTDNVNFSNMTWTPPDVSKETTFTIRLERGDGRGKTNYGQFDVVVKPGFDISSTKQAIGGVDDDRFGMSISISDNYAVIGAKKDNDNGYSSGTAYIYRIEDETLTKEAKLIASDGSSRDEFGSSVSIDENFAIISAKSGSYIFEKLGDNWIEQIKLPEVGSVGISGDYAIAGSAIYKKEDGNWKKHSELPISGKVSISGNYAIIQTSIYKLSEDRWQKEGQVEIDGSYYSSVSISKSGYYAAVTTPSGYVYIAKRVGETWATISKFLDVEIDEGESINTFHLSISDDYLITGYTRRGGYCYSGYANIFKRKGDSWIKQSKLSYSGYYGCKEYFGWSVGLSKKFAFVSAPISERVYIYTLPTTSESPELRVSYNKKIVSADGGSLSLNVSNIGNKSKDMHWNAKTDASWIILENFSSTNDGILNINYSANHGPSRSASIYITANGVNSLEEIIITQTKFEEFKLLASDGSSLNTFGFSVSIDGNYAVIGSDTLGSAYIFKRDGNEWLQMIKLFPSNDADMSFGQPVFISGDYAIIGAVRDDEKSSAYIFKRNENTWIEQTKLSASDGAANFGRSVSISENYAIIGAVKFEDEGSVYIFKKDGGKWKEHLKLIPSGIRAGFGRSVSIDGDYAIVGTPRGGYYPGFAYIFHRIGDTWIESEKLSKSRYGDHFGSSVSISGNFAIVDGSKHVTIYIRDGDRWIEHSELMRSGGNDNSSLVSISGDNIIVGVLARNDQQGSAYIYRKIGSIWTEYKRIFAFDGVPGDTFGWSVSISSNYAIVGSWLDSDNGLESGSAYIYSIPDPTTPILGDTNGDGIVDLQDFIICLKILVGKSQPVFYKGAVDFNGNGIIDIKEANLILKIISGQ